MTDSSRDVVSNVRLAKKLWPNELTPVAIAALRKAIRACSFSLLLGDLIYLDGRWYVTHAGLLRLARRNRCRGIQIQPVREFCDPGAARYAFRAIVYRSSKCRGFVGYGDADPSNVSPLVRGAEMRVAEARA